MAKEKKPMTPKKRKAWLICWGVAGACVLGGFAYATYYATTWNSVLGPYLGFLGTSAVDNSHIVQEEKDTLNAIVDEGSVLLENKNGALPLAKGAKITPFGQTSFQWYDKEHIGNNRDTRFFDSLTSAGLEVNSTSTKFYKRTPNANWGAGPTMGAGFEAGNWKIDEPALADFSSSAAITKENYSDYGDAAVVVFSRSSGEGGDLPRYMGRYGGSDDESYLELNTNERDLLKAIKSSGAFKHTIVILHTNNPMQVDFMEKEIAGEDYGVDGLLWIPGTGVGGADDISDDGVNQIGKVLTGEVNPSGHTADTFTYDIWSAPAMQNVGDNRFLDAEGQPLKDTLSACKDTGGANGGGFSYLNYAEGIYVGYKYYETRYADKILNNSAGNYDYAKTVAYPFGHGLSYTQFDWSNFSASEPSEKGKITLKVTVKNSGAVSGKEVVGFYSQAPYSAGGTEKSAVNLVEFAKSSLLAPGASETLSVTIDKSDLKSYDAKTEKTYVLDGGKYSLTAAKDAHEATNNFLAKLGKGTGDGMTSSGNAALVKDYSFEKTLYATSEVTGKAITNRFDDAKLADATYLSRSNWSALDSFDRKTGLGGIAYASGNLSSKSLTMDKAGNVRTHAAPKEVIIGLTKEGFAASGIPTGIDDASYPSVSYSSKQTSLKLKDMVGVAYDDPKWDDLANQMSQEEQTTLSGQSAYGNVAIDSVGKPETHYCDGPQGVINYVNKTMGFQFADEEMLGLTWNKDLALKEGQLIARENSLSGISAWWGPALNTHRTPFGGRNFEYLSEDGVFAGLMGSPEVTGSETEGVNVQCKHFFLNDQETNRNANGRCAIFGLEQAFREIYAKPFETCIVSGKATGVMSGMNRIGTIQCPTSYAAMTGLLREEWGSQGANITDSQNLTIPEADQMIAAGCDMSDTPSKLVWSDEFLSSKGGQYRLHVAAKNILFATVNSLAITTPFVQGFPAYVIYLIVMDVLAVLFLAYETAEVLWHVYPDQTIVSKKNRWVIRWVFWALAVVTIATALTFFFVKILPDLIFALQNY